MSWGYHSSIQDNWNFLQGIMVESPKCIFCFGWQIIRNTYYQVFRNNQAKNKYLFCISIYYYILFIFTVFNSTFDYIPFITTVCFTPNHALEFFHFIVPAVSKCYYRLNFNSPKQIVHPLLRETILKLSLLIMNV